MTVIHHLRQGQGWGRPTDWMTLPLCVYDHDREHGIHGDKQRIKALKLEEIDLLGETRRVYFETYEAKR